MAEFRTNEPVSGRNQRALRDHNERLLLTLLRNKGPQSGRDIAKSTGLSPQTVSVILRALEADGLVRKGDPVRGKVGKPSIPLILEPMGALSVGLKVGRRSADLVVMDFNGVPLRQVGMIYRYPTPEGIIAFVKESFPDITADLTDQQKRQIAGIGVAIPSEIWNWLDALGASEADMEAWKDCDLRGAIADATGLSAFLENDATAAARAEQAFGEGRGYRTYAYIFIGVFIGGGIVLDRSVFAGVYNNAAAFGPLPTRTDDDLQLIDATSLYLLEDALENAGLDPAQLWTEPFDWTGLDALVEDWIAFVAPHLADAAMTLAAVIDFEAILIDGAFPPNVREKLIARVRDAMRNVDARGLVKPQIVEGTLGPLSRALGAAEIPLSSLYFLGNDAIRN